MYYSSTYFMKCRTYTQFIISNDKCLELKCVELPGPFYFNVLGTVCGLSHLFLSTFYNVCMLSHSV